MPESMSVLELVLVLVLVSVLMLVLMSVLIFAEAPVFALKLEIVLICQ